MNQHNPITAETIVVRCEDVITAEMDEDLVMMSMKSNRYYGLDEIARRIWDLTRKPVSVTLLCEQLTDEFEVEPDQCLQDVLGFLEELRQEGLIRLDPCRG